MYFYLKLVYIILGETNIKWYKDGALVFKWLNIEFIYYLSNPAKCASNFQSWNTILTELEVVYHKLNWQAIKILSYRIIILSGIVRYIHFSYGNVQQCEEAWRQ